MTRTNYKNIKHKGNTVKKKTKLISATNWTAVCSLFGYDGKKTKKKKKP